MVVAENPRRLKQRIGSLKVLGVKRNADGYWTIRARANVHVALLDGRLIIAAREVHIRALQTGRKR